MEKYLDLLKEVNRIGTWHVDIVSKTVTWDAIVKEIHEVPDDFVPNLETGINFYKEGYSRDKIQEVVGKAMEDGAPYDVQLQIVTAKDNIVWVRAIGRVEKDESGNFLSMYGTFENIDEYKKKEDASRFEAEIINDSQVGIWSWDLADEVVFSEGWKRQIGYDDHEIKNDADEWFSRVHPDDLEKANQQVQDHITGKTEFYVNEHRMKHKDGYWVWILAQGKIVDWDDDGNPTLFIGTHLDITQRKEEEALLNKFFDLSLDFMCIANTEGYFEKVNAAFIDRLGYSHEELMKKSFVEFIHPNDVKSTLEEVKKLEDKSYLTLNFTNRYLTKSGEIIYMKWVASPDEETGQLYCAARDITEEVKALETNTKYTKMFENSSSGILVIDKDSKILECNNRVCRMFNFDNSELLGEHLDKLLPDVVKGLKHQKLVDGYRDQPTSRKMVHNFEFKGLNKVGEEIPLDIKLNYFNFDEEMYCVAFLEDISEKLKLDEMRKETEELIRKNVIAEAAAKNKQQFLANMSHEIRTPMNGIIGLIDILDHDAELNEKQQGYISTIKDSSLSLLNIINDVLDLSKLEEGRMKVLAMDFNLRNTISNIKDLYRTKVLEKKIDFRVQVDDEVPSVLRGDEHRLKQVLTNLISNAIKFTDEGGVGVNVSALSVDEGETRLRFEVADSGIGIDMENKQDLFDTYEQADSSLTKQYSGTGLGLGISKKLVEMFGCKIGFNSELGKGSVFYIEVPFDVVSTKKDLETNSTESVDLDLNKDIKLLLVDDKKVNVMVAKLMLQKMGIEPETAVNGLEAIEKLQQDDFDIVLMDIQMPVMNGLDATMKIKQEKLSDAKIIALTANAMEGDEEKYLSSGFDGYLPKPIQLDTLKSTLSKI